MSTTCRSALFGFLVIILNKAPGEANCLAITLHLLLAASKRFPLGEENFSLVIDVLRLEKDFHCLAASSFVAEALIPFMFH